MKKILEFLSENFQFFVVKFSVYLNRRVFVMKTTKVMKSLGKLFWTERLAADLPPKYGLFQCLCHVTMTYVTRLI